MPDELPTIEHTEYKISLYRQADTWRWLRIPGFEWVSPAFSTKEAAHYFAGKIPFLSDEEWKQFNPINE